jgi:hypothetical protein
LPRAVDAGLDCQRGVQIVVHRVVGPPLPTDQCHWQTIARARNEGKRRGVAPWLMFVDDDVVLEPECVAMLLGELNRRPLFGAVAADYLGEMSDGQVPRHVAMGATLFRREVLEQVDFRWGEQKCECQCCCDDMRQSLWGIAYSSAARAHHIAEEKSAQVRAAGAKCSFPTDHKGQLLAAFNRRDLLRFHEQFLASLRATGNQECVIPVAIGLYPSERKRLAQVPGVRPVFHTENGQNVARRRLRDFAEITATLPSAMPVAYWDAGDVIFQAPIQSLWEMIRSFPGQLLAAREPLGYPENCTMIEWTETIADPAARRDAVQVLFKQPFLNSGFLAGDAGAMAKYFQTVADWYDTPRLAGSFDWGDQMALNLYCHSNPQAWREIPEGWNYCLWRRDRSMCYRRDDGHYVDVRGTPIQVVHGNARTLAVRSIRHSPF